MNKIFILISFFYLTYTVNAVKPKEEIENISIIWEKCQSTFFCENVEKNLQKKNAILYFSNLSETYKPYWIRSLLLLCKHFYTLHGNNIELMLDLIDYHWNDNKDLFYSEYLSMKVGDNHYIISDKDISEKMSNLSLVHEIFFSLNDGFSKAKDGFHRASLLFDNETFKYLYNDDIENFSLIFNTTNFSQKTKNLLLSYSILFSSVKCFKFIFLNLESNLHQIQGTMRLATLSGNLEIIRICEQNGCLPDRYTYSIFSDINEWLIDVRGLDDWDLTCNLIRAKEIGAACSLISKNCDSILSKICNTSDNNKRIKFFKSACNHMLPIFKFSLEAYKSLNKEDTESLINFLLVQAFMYTKDIKTTEYLLESGANINVTDRKAGNTLLHWAVSHRKNDIYKYLFKNSTEDDVYKYLLEHGADVNITNKDGNTPLHLAVYYGYYNACKYLISKYKADVNAVNENGNTPLLYAILQDKSRLTIIKYLLKHGADVNITNKDGKNALSLARDNEDLYQCLMLHGNKK